MKNVVPGILKYGFLVLIWERIKEFLVWWWISLWCWPNQLHSRVPCQWCWLLWKLSVRNSFYFFFVSCILQSLWLDLCTVISYSLVFVLALTSFLIEKGFQLEYITGSNAAPTQPVITPALPKEALDVGVQGISRALLLTEDASSPLWWTSTWGPSFLSGVC